MCLLSRVPRGVVCLLSALRFHDLTTKSPFEVWEAIECEGACAEGRNCSLASFISQEKPLPRVETHTIYDVDVKVYRPTTTVADSFEYRNKIGLDVAIEARAEWVPKEARN